MCCWVKFSKLYPDSALGGAMGGQHRYSKSTGMGLTIKHVSETTGYLSCNTGKGGGDSNRTYNTYCGNTLMNANIWYHVAFTYDGSTIKFYLNGKFDGSHSYTGQVNVEDYIIVGAWSLDGTTGNIPYGGYKLHGTMNDFRIYNHVLSKKEIRYISQGLAAHWQLKGTGRTNYLKGADIYTRDNPLIRNATDVSHMYDSYIYHSQFTVNIPTAGPYTFVCQTDATPSGHHTGSGTSSMRTFNIFLQHQTTGNHYAFDSFGSGSNNEKYGYFSSLPVGTYNVRTNLYAADNVNYTVKFWNIKMVRDSYDPSDVYCPHVEDPLYTTMDFGISTEPDCSGFSNDMNKDTMLDVVSGSPRYGRSYYFNGISRLSNQFTTTGWTDFTIAAWVNPVNLNNGDDRSCVLIGGMYLTIEPDGKIGTYCYGKSKEGYHVTSTAIPTGSWSHLVAVWDNLTATHRVYINGVERLTVTGCSGSCSSTNHIKKEIGMEGTSRRLTGYISDLRIYGTALSTSDVIDLYKNSASVDNDGNLFGYDFHENGRNTVDKDGIVASGGFIDKTVPTYDMKVKGLPDGSTWGRIHHLDLTHEKNFFASASEVANCTNKNNRYSLMGKVNKYQPPDGNYEFMLTYPKMKKTLPAGYTKLEYIEATGTQYIRTGVYPYADGSYVRGHRWELDIEFKANGIRQLMGYGPNGYEYWGMNDNVYEGMSVPVGKRDTIVHDYSGGTAGGNTLWVQNSYRDVGSNLTTDQEYTLFNLKWGGNTGYWCYAKLYGCKCIQGSTLIRNFIPAMRNSDGAIGLFDIVNNIFYGNSGSGSFYSNYTWLDYLQSSGTQYINTGVIPNSNTRIVVKALLSTPYSIYGVNQSGAAFNMTGSSSNGGVMYYYWGGGGASKMTNMYNEVHIFEQNKNVCYVDNNIYHIYTYSSWAATAPMFLFGRNNGTALNDAGTVRIYNCQIYDNGTLIRDFVPCLTNGTPGMYDLVNNAFYANAGSGSFKIGYKGNEYQWLEYIQNTGMEFINTGYPAPEGFISEAVIEYVTKQGGYVLGSHNTVAPWGRNGYGINGIEQWELGTGDTCPASSSTVALNTRYTIKASTVKGNSYMDVNGTRVITTSDSSARCTGTIYVFRNQYEQYHNAASSQIKLYSLKFWLPNGTLIRDFLPCISPSGKVGLYDKITKRFFGNSGPGSLIAGPAKESLPLYNRWIQNGWTTDVNQGDNIGFKSISTSWPEHNGPIKPANSSTDCLYDCDNKGTGNWYAPIGQYRIWEGGIPAANGFAQLETELWVRLDRFNEANKLQIYNSCMVAKSFNEI